VEDPFDRELQESEVAGRAFRAGVLGNGLLALGKLGVGWLSGSRALLADGWHSLADVATNGATWIAHGFARRAPDDDHHYGHGKLEAFAGLIVGLLLFGGGVAIAVSAFDFDVRLVEGWRTWVALAVALVSIAVNLVLARIAQVGARETKSDGLRALARDNLSDALSSGLVVVAILGTAVGLPWPEPVATFVIGVVVLSMGWNSVREGFDVLMDRADPELRAAITRTAGQVEAVRGVQSVRVHPLGGSVAVDMEISVSGALTVEEGHEIAHSVERAVTREHPSVRAVHVHVNPGPPPYGTEDESLLGPSG